MTRVLIVDDDRDIARLLSLILRREGMHVQTASSGSEALVALEGFSPEAVVTDLNMAHLDGLELCRALRASPRFARMPVLIYTAVHRDDPRLIEAGRLPGVTIAIKPLGADGLIATLRDLLDGRGGGKP